MDEYNYILSGSQFAVVHIQNILTFTTHPHPPAMMTMSPSLRSELRSRGHDPMGSLAPNFLQ